jgi:hypothetical protein
MFLSPVEIADLTGISKKKPLQIKWLEKHRIAYTVKADGRLNVLRKLVEQKHGVKSTAPEEYVVHMERMHT